ncbi:hypothetical protein LTR17_023127 [Elasticomyces elasticus]|nr:hypothetical protein LTR17_023127 [Elasticomyces elasticus]
MDQLIGRPLRLINVETGHLESVKWRDYDASSAPRYAILSHTWGPDNTEVSLSEWQNSSDNVMARAGYRKIVGACELAKKEGLGFVWVDTCCIDKSDKEELSRAINSMFNWYANATVCYALLSDVSGQPNSRDTRGQMGASRWFTRGWTLQEMLAPSRVDFYTRDWVFLGTRADRVRDLTEITGIDKAVLEGSKELSDYSAAQKFSWASKRFTSELEDVAYSLLGIVGIRMTLDYGEGGLAFRRLQVELLNNGDLSVLAWGLVESSKSTQLLATSPSDFSGSGILFPDTSHVPQDHSMMYKGLNGTLSVCRVRWFFFFSSRTHFLAPLGCRVNRFSDEIIALRLKTRNGPLTRGDKDLIVDPFCTTHTSSLIAFTFEGVVSAGGSESTTH